MKLEDIIDKGTLSEFALNYWGEKIFYTGEFFNDIKNFIKLEDIYNLYSDKNNFKKTTVLLRSTNIKNDIEPPTSISEIKEGIKKGYTLQIRNLQNIMPKNSDLIKTMKEFESSILQPIDSVTFFYSEPHSLPTAIHKDLGEIFSFQVSGKKLWRISENKELSDNISFTENEFTNVQEHVLSSGNVMYLPSFLPHQVKCIEEPSTSVAFVFRNIQMKNILLMLAQDPEIKHRLHKPLPILGDERLTNESYSYIEEMITVCKDKISNLNEKEICSNFKNELKKLCLM